LSAAFEKNAKKPQAAEATKINKQIADEGWASLTGLWGFIRYGKERKTLTSGSLLPFVRRVDRVCPVYWERTKILF
jgi:hypothetical protein